MKTFLTAISLSLALGIFPVLAQEKKDMPVKARRR